MTKRKSRCKKKARVNEKELIELAEEVIDKIGHENLNFLYQMNKRIRSELYLHRFPIAFIYKHSLSILFDEEYARLQTSEIAEKEGLSYRTAHNLRIQSYDKKDN